MRCEVHRKKKKEERESLSFVETKKTIIEDFTIRKPLVRKDYFVFGMGDRTNTESITILMQIKFNTLEIFYGKLTTRTDSMSKPLPKFKTIIELISDQEIIIIW